MLQNLMQTMTADPAGDFCKKSHVEGRLLKLGDEKSSNTELRRSDIKLGKFLQKIKIYREKMDEDEKRSASFLKNLLTSKAQKKQQSAELQAAEKSLRRAQRHFYRAVVKEDRLRVLGMVRSLKTKQEKLDNKQKQLDTKQKVLDKKEEELEKKVEELANRLPVKDKLIELTSTTLANSTSTNVNVKSDATNNTNMNSTNFLLTSTLTDSPDAAMWILFSVVLLISLGFYRLWKKATGSAKTPEDARPRADEVC
jgi:hypothetical protein